MEISWKTLHMLEQTHGDSFFLLDLEAFQDNYFGFLEAFRRYYPKSDIAYSCKTNYIPKLLHCVNEMGGYAEVVSRMEYDLALRVGFPAQKIIFNGPYKRKTDLKEALLGGSIVNLDSSYEVGIVEEIAQSSPDKIITVGVRCNLRIDTGSVSRFGFDVDGKELQSVFETLGRLGNCQVAGLHCHFRFLDRSTESYAQCAGRMLELAAVHFRDNYPLFIDLGGGFFGKMSLDLRKQFPFHVPTYQEYAEAVGSQFAKAFPNDSGPELILEPGMAITADIMKFVAKVVDIKEVHSRVVALVSGSVHNIKPTLSPKNLPVRVWSVNSKSKRSSGPLDIVGYTCMEIDCLYQGYEGSLSVGDYVVFENVGAYTIVLKPPFILPCPVILAYDSALGEFQLVKRQEELSDVFSTYVF